MLKLMICGLILMLPKMGHTKESRFYTSTADFEQLVDTEEEIIKVMQNYVKVEKRRLQLLSKYVERSKMEYELAIKDAEYYFGNPINAYTIIKRLSVDLTEVENVLRNQPELQTPNAIFPTEEDIHCASDGILAMVTTYNLNVTDFANGIINTTARRGNELYTEVVTPMTASDCYTIAMSAMKDELYTNAVEWLEEAYRKVEESKCEICIVSLIDIIDQIATAYHQLDDKANYKKWVEKRISLKPDDMKSMTLARYIHFINVEGPEMNEIEKRVEKQSDDICVGKLRVNNSDSLSCYYAHGPHPFLTLGPLKAEMLHRNPDITMFYQVLSDDEIETLLNISKPLLWNKTKDDTSIFRNAEYVNLEEESSDVVARANRRAFDLSGMNPEESEPFKVVNYGIGGFSHGHWDTSGIRIPHHVNIDTYNKSQTNDTWDRAGTILFYLSDVELGGATVFPAIHLTVFPVKGAALFWLNHLPSGSDDTLLFHHGCPVLRGTKYYFIIVLISGLIFQTQVKTSKLQLSGHMSS